MYRYVTVKSGESSQELEEIILDVGWEKDVMFSNADENTDTYRFRKVD